MKHSVKLKVNRLPKLHINECRKEIAEKALSTVLLPHTNCISKENSSLFPCINYIFGSAYGLKEILLAERNLLIGEENEAKVFAGQAKYKALEHGDDKIFIYALVIFARIAIGNGDTKRFCYIYNAIKQHIPKCNKKDEVDKISYNDFYDILLGNLFLMLGIDDEIPAWLQSPEDIRKRLDPGAFPLVRIFIMRHIQQTQPDEFAEAVRFFLSESAGHLLTMIYICLESASFYERNGLRKTACEWVQKAFDYALPEGIYLPFAEYYEQLSGVFKDIKTDYSDEKILARIQSTGRNFVMGKTAIRAAFSGCSPLTPREREIAALAKERFSTKEIASKLYISAATVKNTLNKIYSKLNITGKPELRDKQF